MATSKIKKRVPRRLPDSTMKTETPLPAAAPWHPCTDGITPIVNAIDQFLAKSVIDIKTGLQHASTSPSYELTRAMYESGMGQGTRCASRREMTRRWLQFNGWGDDAREVERRLDDCLERIKAWESVAANDYTSDDRVFSERVGDQFDLIEDVVYSTADYLRQLEVMLNAKLTGVHGERAKTSKLKGKPLLAFNYIKEHPGALGKNIASACGIAHSTFKRMAKDLKLHGVTNNKGGDGYYPPMVMR